MDSAVMGGGSYNSVKDGWVDNLELGCFGWCNYYLFHDVAESRKALLIEFFFYHTESKFS
jgi:hypothetical protein